MREMLRAMQAGEMTVSRGVELVDIWLAGNYSDDRLPPVRNIGLGEDDMPADVIIALRAELERERMRLAACGVVALADTPDSAATARDMHPDYRSASCDDVARRVDECIALRSEVAALRAALLDVARRVEALKRPCGMDPETPQAIRNGEYMSIALIARNAIDAARSKE